MSLCSIVQPNPTAPHGSETTGSDREPADPDQTDGEEEARQRDPMKLQRYQQQVQEGGARTRLLAGTPSRHDAPDPDDGAARAVTITKGCATFWVGEAGEAPRRVAVPVARLGHPRMLELLGEAREEYGFAHQSAVVVPCAVERFMRAVEASASVGGSHGHGHRYRHHHHHFRLPHIHIARCFRPSHVVA